MKQYRNGQMGRMMEYLDDEMATIYEKKNEPILVQNFIYHISGNGGNRHSYIFVLKNVMTR